jgi:hypothetical protein
MLSAQIEEQIRAEIALQVQQEVAAQIGGHLPTSLEQQAEASKRQLVEVRHSLVNSWVSLETLRSKHSLLINGFTTSEARRANSVLRSNNCEHQ